MTLGTHIYTAEMTIGPEREARFNEVYDTDHIPALKQVAGVVEVRRFRRVEPPATFYLAIYEIAGPEVPLSRAWLTQRDVGRWPTEIRPHLLDVRNGTYARQAAFGDDPAGDGDPPLLLLVRTPAGLGGVPGLSHLLEAARAQPHVLAGAHYRDVDDGSELVLVGFDRSLDMAGEAQVATAAAPEGAIVELYASLTADAST